MEFGPQVHELSPTIRHLVKEGKVRVVGGVYDVASGTVKWLGDAAEFTAGSASSSGDDRSQAAPGVRIRRPLLPGRR